MAATKDSAPARRGNSRGAAFGYPVAPGEKIFKGTVMCVNAAGQSVRPQTAGALAFIGISESGYDNTGSSAPGPKITGQFDDFKFPVPGASYTLSLIHIFQRDGAKNLRILGTVHGRAATIVIKASGSGAEVFVLSFHFVRPKAVRGFLKRDIVLRGDAAAYLAGLKGTR